MGQGMGQSMGYAKGETMPWSLEYKLQGLTYKSDTVG